MDIIAIPGFSEPVSSLSHLIAAFIVSITAGFLIRKGRGNRLRLFGLILYTFSAIFLFSMSGVYHLLEKGTSASYVLRILDHDGIYLLIAGTFTPLHIILMRGWRRWLILAIIWILGITGLTLTSIFFSSMPELMILIFFLSMGWMATFTIYALYKVNKEIAKYVIFGGLAYTVGATLDFLRWPNLINGVVGPHELFHFFVVAGAAYHWFAIYKIADIPIARKLRFLVNDYLPEKMQVRALNEKLEFSASSEDEMHKIITKWVDESYLELLKPESTEFEFIRKDFREL